MTELNNNDNINISCIYCLFPKIIFDPSISLSNLTTKCFLGHQIDYNIDDYITLKNKQNEYIENTKCDKCKAHKDNMTYCSDEKLFICAKCLPKEHKDKDHNLYDLTKIDICPTHKKDYLYCKNCDAIFCKFCDANETHLKHEFCNIKNYFLNQSEEELIQCIIIKLNKINNDFQYNIFNSNLNEIDYSNTIFKYRQSEINLYNLIFKDYKRNKSKNFNSLFNVRNCILKKYSNINNLSYIDFIKETKIPDEKEESKNSLIKHLIEHNYINFESSSYNDDKNILTLKDKNNPSLYIDHFLILKDAIFIVSGFNCLLYNMSMELICQFKPEELNNDKNILISHIHLKKYNDINNTEIIYAFIPHIIYEIILSKDEKGNYTYKIIKHENKRVSHKVDGVIDMKNGDLIICCHMYPVICFRKNQNNIFEEYTSLTDEKPYIKNAVNIIHLSDDEFVTTSNSWNCLIFHKYQENNDNKGSDYQIIKEIKLNCSKKTNTLSLLKNEIIIVGLDRDGICLISAKYKEIVSTIKGIDSSYIFVRSNEEIIINEVLENYYLATICKVYKIENEELCFKGLLKSKFQFRVKQIMENSDKNLFISEFGNSKEKYSYIYVDKSLDN